MAIADNGLEMTLRDALVLLTDGKGNHLDFKEDKDSGIWKTEPIEGDKDSKGNSKYVYQYSLTPKLQLVTVNMTKNLKEDLEKAKSKEAEQGQEQRLTYSGTETGTSKSKRL